MLILTRKAGESILIGDDIEVTITSIDQNKVEWELKAPPTFLYTGKSFTGKSRKRTGTRRVLARRNLKVCSTCTPEIGRADPPTGDDSLEA